METFLWLVDRSLLDDMVKSIISQSHKCKDQLLLKEIIGSSGFWDKASDTERGRKALKDFVEERIHKLKSEHEPGFTWCQPIATLPTHREVEAFSRGPLEKFTYFGNFNGLKHARIFGNMYFGYGMSGCYSATAQEGGRGKAAYCEIVKTCRVFEEMKRQWAAGRQELAMLQSKLHELLGTTSPDEISGPALIMDALPDGENSFDVNKRLKIDVEPLGSRKEHPIVL
ncbi:hypothetical protein L7F22_057578 [Adiantum nelumboides]|nr:hypothetical protein [Adiantum nelumboides]